MTAEDVGFYHIGGKVKLMLPGGEVVEDYLDDLYIDGESLYTYILVLRGRGNVSMGSGSFFEWRPE